jgi:hypothetical protein
MLAMVAFSDQILDVGYLILDISEDVLSPSLYDRRPFVCEQTASLHNDRWVGHGSTSLTILSLSKDRTDPVYPTTHDQSPLPKGELLTTSIEFRYESERILIE